MTKGGAQVVGDTSPMPASTTFPAALDDASPRGVCDFCRRGLEVPTRRDARFCSQRCRQSAYRLRRRRATEAQYAKPLRFAYADPPYIGRAKKYYGDQPTYGGEVDHVALIASLTTSYDGWALSAAADSLRFLLPLCPPEAKVCPWVKPIGAAPATYGLHNTWEPLIVFQGRHLQPGRRDWLSAMPARGGGDLPGRKPLAFCAWLFECLGMVPGDSLDDLFPGTGIVTQAWRELSREAFTDVSREYFDDASSTARADSFALEAAPGDASLTPGRPAESCDPSLPAFGYASRSAESDG